MAATSRAADPTMAGAIGCAIEAQRLDPHRRSSLVYPRVGNPAQANAAATAAMAQGPNLCSQSAIWTPASTWRLLPEYDSLAGEEHQGAV